MPFLFFLLIFRLQAGIIQDDVLTTDKVRYSLRTVCAKTVSHESPLIEIISSTEIDCMGKKIDVATFCEKQLAHDPYYLRAYVDNVSKEVVCHSGKKVILKYQCIKLAERKYCEQEAKVSCLELKQKLAKRLDLVHASVTKNDKKLKELNCYFESLPKHEGL